MVEQFSFINYLIWPPVATELDARRARIVSLGISIYCAFNWALLAIIGSFSNHYIYRGWDIGYALLFTVISLGLYKMQREAAVGGFLFCLIGLTFGEPTSDWSIIQTLIMLVSYFQAIRGTFAYVRISQGQ